MGLRMVRMYVEEFFNWGFQQIDQENDDGLDGLIIVRDKKGEDTGGRIHCQIKCGNGYNKGVSDGKISIQPYTPKSTLIQHLEMYKRMVEPTILVYVDPGNLDKDGKLSFGKNPPCWWIRLDNYEHDGSSVIKIPRASRFGEHSKGDLFRMVKPLLKNWINFPEVTMDLEDRKLWYSNNLKADARDLYSKTSSINMQLTSDSIPVYVTRIGWRHINNKRRSDSRRNNSLKLLSVAFKFIANGQHRLIFLREKETSTVQCRELYHALRFRLKMNHETLKVQIVLRNWVNPQKGIDKFWFYSVHIIG